MFPYALIYLLAIPLSFLHPNLVFAAPTPNYNDAQGDLQNGGSALTGSGGEAYGGNGGNEEGLLGSLISIDSNNGGSGGCASSGDAISSQHHYKRSPYSIASSDKYDHSVVSGPGGDASGGSVINSHGGLIGLSSGNAGNGGYAGSGHAMGRFESISVRNDNKTKPAEKDESSYTLDLDD